jgi:hypothetical protein
MCFLDISGIFVTEENYMTKNGKAVKVMSEGPMGWIMFMAYIGAAIYFFNVDPTFWGFILALLKAAVWPAYVLYEVLTILGVR